MKRVSIRVQPTIQKPGNAIKIGSVKQTIFNKTTSNGLHMNTVVLSRKFHSDRNHQNTEKNQSYNQSNFFDKQLHQISQISNTASQQNFGWLLLLVPFAYMLMNNDADAAEKQSARELFEQKKKLKVQEEKDEEQRFKVIRAVRLMEQGNAQEALQIIDELIEQNPDEMDFYVMKLAMLFELGVFGEVINVAEDILDIDPKNVAALSYKGFAFSEMGLTDEALDAYDDLLRVDPENPTILTARGRALFEVARVDEGIASCEKAIHFDKNEHTAFICKGIGLMMKRDLDNAVRAFETAIKTQPEDPDSYFRKGLVLIEQEKFAEAVRYLEQAIQLEPSHYDAWNAKGYAHIQLGQNFEGQRSIAHAKRIIAQFEKEQERFSKAAASQADRREQEQQYDDNAVFGIKGRRGRV